MFCERVGRRRSCLQHFYAVCVGRKVLTGECVVCDINLCSGTSRSNRMRIMLHAVNTL
jgi:hypothetical protein